MTDQHRRFRRAAVRVLRRYTIHWYVGAAVLYALLIPLSVWVFPSTTLMLTVIVLGTGLLSSVGSLASVLVDLDADEDTPA